MLQTISNSFFVEQICDQRLILIRFNSKSFKGPSNHSQPQDHERFWTFSLKFNYLQLNIYRRWNGGETISSTHQNSKCFQSIKFKSMNKFWPKFNSVSWSWGQVTKLALPSFDFVLCDHTKAKRNEGHTSKFYQGYLS